MKRIVPLVLAVWFYSWAGLAIGLLAGARPSLGQIAMCVMPFTTEHYWFIDVYLILCLLMPFVNKAIEGIDRKRYRGILLVGLVLFSVLPTVVPFASEIFALGGGSNIVWFVMLYLIGGYIRLYDPLEKWSCAKLCSGFALLSLAAFAVKLAAQAGASVLFGKQIGGGLLYHHNSVTVIAAAVLLFSLMQRLDVGENTGRKISAVAACTFGVYLGHEHELFRTSFWQALAPYLPASPFAWTLAMIGLILAVFCFFALVEACRKKLFLALGEDALADKVAGFVEGCR